MKLNNPEDWNELFLPINDNTFGSEQYIENDTDKINAKLKMFIGITQSSDWIGFVEEMLNYCPFVRKRGRPSDENIKNVVLVEYPRKGSWAVGFATRENKSEISIKAKQNLVNVFVPTTPNPTSGFLLMFPKEEVIYLDMSFEEASRFIVSAGSSEPK